MKEPHVVMKDHHGYFAMYKSGGHMYRTYTKWGAIWKAKRLNRYDELRSQPPIPVWEPKQQTTD